MILHLGSNIQKSFLPLFCQKKWYEATPVPPLFVILMCQIVTERWFQIKQNKQMLLTPQQIIKSNFLTHTWTNKKRYLMNIYDTYWVTFALLMHLEKPRPSTLLRKQENWQDIVYVMSLIEVPWYFWEWTLLNYHHDNSSDIVEDASTLSNKFVKC